MSYNPYYDPEDPYLALMEAAYGGWSPDDEYYYKNQLPEQLYDQVKPRSDAAANTMVNRMVGGAEGWENFSNDVILQADPLIQPYLTELLANNKGDLASSMNDWNSTKDETLERIGRTAWDQIQDSADTPTRRAMMSAQSGEEKDQVAYDYISRALENVLAQGAPSVARNTGLQDWGLQRVGARPIPGGEIPMYGGEGFGGGAAAGGAPQGGGMGPLEESYASRLIQDSGSARRAAEADPFISDRNLQYVAQAERQRTGGSRPASGIRRPTNPSDPFNRGWGRGNRSTTSRRNKPKDEDNGWLGRLGRMTQAVAGIG